MFIETYIKKDINSFFSRCFAESFGFLNNGESMPGYLNSKYERVNVDIGRKLTIKKERLFG
jgi:hypothetical protein